VSEGTPPPAGWYIDPDGSDNERWWDGVRWTEHMKAARAIPALPAEHGTTQTPEPPAGPVSPDLSHWRTAIDALPEEPTGPSPLRGVPHGTETTALKGLSLQDAGHGNGRPTWWSAEPATGNAILGWEVWPTFVLRFTPDYVCDMVYVRGPNELELSWRVRILGNLIQRSIAEVVQVLGPPNSRGAGHSHILLQWHQPGFHVALKFGRDGKCLGITHQYAARPSRI
jgi:uncharacterized protein DUF2510